MRKKFYLLGGFLITSLIFVACDSATVGTYQGYQTEWNEEEVRQNQEEGFTKVDEDSVKAAQTLKDQDDSKAKIEEFQQKLEEEKVENERRALKAQEELNSILLNVLEAVEGTKDEVTGVKKEVSGIKKEITGVKNEVTKVKDYLKEYQNYTKDINDHAKDIKKDVRDMKDDVADIKDELKVIEKNQRTHY